MHHRTRFVLAAALVAVPGFGQHLTPSETKTVVGDSVPNPGPLATDLSSDLNPKAIQKAMKKVADWQLRRVADSLSQDWTFATLYVGFLAASRTLKQPTYHDLVLGVAEHYQWRLGPREKHADDQAIGQVYLELFAEKPDPNRLIALRKQFDNLVQQPDDPAKPVWWWCDALFMAPPVWTGLAEVTHDPRYIDYMDREWHLTSNLLWDSEEHLFLRDANYLNMREKDGRKMFWSRGNGWVMGGLVKILQDLPSGDPRREFYVRRLQDMAATVAAIQGDDGLWRAGLLDAESYPNPEISGSAFFIYAMTWGMEHGMLDPIRYRPVVQRAWRGMLQHIYQDGRLGDIQPVGEAPGAYDPSSSYVFGVGAFLLAGSELNQWLNAHPAPAHSRSSTAALRR